MTANTLTSTVPQPAARPATPAAMPATPAAMRAPAPSVARSPRPVRATTHAGGIGFELLLATADAAPPSALDVDPRILVVHRPANAVAAAPPPRRSLSPPTDARRELRERRRRVLLTLCGGFGGAIAVGLSVATALA